MTPLIPPALQDIEDAFSFLEAWDDKYEYLLDLADRMPPLAASEKTADYTVKGCMAQVWLVPEVQGGRLYIRADSDAQLVRGLIAVLRAAYDGQQIAAIPQIDIRGAFSRMGLETHLSPNRRNGFFAMVGKVKTLSSTGRDQP
ncbi:MAG: SufE family protein [Pseudomonadota bacterium]